MFRFNTGFGRHTTNTTNVPQPSLPDLSSEFESLRGTIEDQAASIEEATDPTTVVQPLKEGFDKAASSIEEIRLAETRIANEELRAFEQANEDPRLAATARIRRQRTNDLINSIAGISAETTRSFGEQLTNTLLQAGSLRTQGASAIMQGAEALASLQVEEAGIRSQMATSLYDTNTDAMIRMAQLEADKREARRGVSGFGGGSGGKSFAEMMHEKRMAREANEPKFTYAGTSTGAGGGYRMGDSTGGPLGMRSPINGATPGYGASTGGGYGDPKRK